MPEKMNLRYPDSVLFLANIDVTSNGSVVAWMNESLDLARSNAYVSIDGNEIEGGDTINAEYFEKNKPIIIKRIAQAATRLARLLNEIADGDRPVALHLRPAD